MGDGHLNRLMADILDLKALPARDPNRTSDKATAPPLWQQCVLKAYILTCAHSILRIIAEDYPTEEDRRKIEWPDARPFPDVSKIGTVRVVKETSILDGEEITVLVDEATGRMASLPTVKKASPPLHT